ncbi:MAG: hypothetical protein IKV25_06975 [Clostridia bacterium]|nr:hypothetical protein [Clostridia bacterium]
MLNRNDALALILKGCTEKFEQIGFTTVVPKNLEKGAAPVFENEEESYLEFTKDDITLRLVSHDNLLDVTEKAGDGDFVKTESNLLDLEEYEERDIKSLCNEICDTVSTSYGKKARQVATKKAPQTISKSAAKNGTEYDANTLASRIATLYPELKDAYKENFQTYDEFLGEDFFVNHANKYIMETIRGNDKQQMKKLFKILSDIYENGSNDVQDLVVVTILGEIDNDENLLAKCRNEITDEDFYQTLVAVNKYLASPAGKKAKELMKNPPAYKPPKKNQGMMSKMMQNSMPPQQ